MDNSEDHEAQKAAFLKKYQVLETRIKAKYGNRVNLQRFFQQNMGKNRDAFFYSWEETLKQEPPHPEAYAQKILDKESGNFNEQDFQKDSAQNKSIYFDIIQKLQGG